MLNLTTSDKTAILIAQFSKMCPYLEFFEVVTYVTREVSYFLLL